MFVENDSSYPGCGTCTLFHLKRALSKEIGSGRLHLELLKRYTRFYAYDGEIHPVAMEMCAYAVKQLVGVHGKSL